MSSSPAADGSKEDKVWSGEVKEKFESKSMSKFFDPCEEAAQRSYKCLHRNQGDRTMCTDYFQAYRDCKQSWTEKRKQDGKRGS